MYSEYKEILKERLNEKRYYHSLCVADEAVRLSEKYGGDTDKAYLAGLLHDITKNASEEEHLKIFTDFGIILCDIEKNAQKLQFIPVFRENFSKSRHKTSRPDFHPPRRAGQLPVK